jgi:hypothetical protein
MHTRSHASTHLTKRRRALLAPVQDLEICAKTSFVLGRTSLEEATRELVPASPPAWRPQPSFGPNWDTNRPGGARGCYVLLCRVPVPPTAPPRFEPSTHCRLPWSAERGDAPGFVWPLVLGPLVACILRGFCRFAPNSSKYFCRHYRPRGRPRRREPFYRRSFFVGTTSGDTHVGEEVFGRTMESF